jgi:hypothetical protein
MSLGVVCYESKNMGRLKGRVIAVVHMMEAADWVGGVLAGCGGTERDGKNSKINLCAWEVAPEFLAFRTKGKIGGFGKGPILLIILTFPEIKCPADEEGITADKRSGKSIMRTGNGNSMLVD